MSNEDDDIDGKKKIANAIVIILLLMALGWVNYLYFIKHISSNPERINNFIAVDNNINKFRVPVSAAFFYPYGQNGHKIMASEISPRIFVVPYTGYLYSEKNVEKAYQWLQPWKQKIKNIILVAQDKTQKDILPTLSLTPEIQFSKQKITISSNLNEFLQSHYEGIFAYKNISQVKAINVQLPLIYNIFGQSVNFATIVYGENNIEQLSKTLEYFIKDPRNMIIFSADMSEYYTQGQHPEDSENIQMIVKLSQKAHLYPKIFDLVNFEDITKQTYRVSELKKEQPLSTLEQEQESLKSFAKLYGSDLMQIAKEALKYAIIEHKNFKPERKKYPDVLFNRGAVFVNLYKQGKKCGSSGSMLPSQAVAFAVSYNTYSAAIEDKDFPPLQQEDLSKITIKLNLLTGYERIAYKNEADLLTKLRVGSDGLVIRDGNRQGIFLPEEWKNYTTPQEFLNNLKIKTGMSPAYWSNKIKVYRFKAVEISKDEN